MHIDIYISAPWIFGGLFIENRHDGDAEQQDDAAWDTQFTNKVILVLL